MQQVRPIPWESFTAEILALYAPPLRARGTLRELRRTLAVFAELARPATTEDLTPPAIGAYIAGRPRELAPHTLSKELRHLRAAANYAAGRGYLGRSPFDARPLRAWVRTPPPAPRLYYPPAAVRAVLDLMAADVAGLEGWAQWRARRTLALTATVAYCGLRRSEALWLHDADVDLEARAIALVDRRAEGRRLKTLAAAQPVPVPAAAVPLLAEWRAHRLDHPADFEIPDDCPWWLPNNNRAGGPWTGGPKGCKPLHRLQAAAARAGYPGMTFQSLRASWATRAESAGYSDLLIQRVLRHTTPLTSAWYRGHDLPALVQAVDGFDY